MIKVVCKGKFSTFEVPVDETQFANVQSISWNGQSIQVIHSDGYNNIRSSVVFGWKRLPFGDCCGADIVTDFSYMIYNNGGLKDSHTPINKQREARYREFWEPWYKEVVAIGMKPAIGLIPSSISKDNTIVERSEFYSWLKSKAIYLSQWKNKIYQDSVIGAYLFVPEGSKLLEIKHGFFPPDDKYV